VTPLSAPERVLQGLGVNDPDDIDLEAIAWTMGAEVRYRPLDGCEARIIGRDDQVIITVNERSSWRRRRFSLAHEIGHWTHHRGRCMICRAEDINRGGENRPVMEKTADRYAANLLMPPYLFRQAIAEHKRLSFQAVKAVADQFRVSRISAAIQTIEARHTPALLVCHGPQGRKWFSRATDVASHWFPQDDLDADSFAFDVLFGRKPDCPSPRKVGADAWFDRRGADRYELREQTIRTGDDEVLTLLLIDDERMLA
jgi:hypothetical protein